MVYSTAAAPLTLADDIASRSRVKVVVDTARARARRACMHAAWTPCRQAMPLTRSPAALQAGYALYFSRAAIPAGHSAALPAPGVRYLLHLGLQARCGARALLRCCADQCVCACAMTRRLASSHCALSATTPPFSRASRRCLPRRWRRRRTWSS